MGQLPSPPPAEEHAGADAAAADGGRRDFGKMEFGCDHYRRRCKVRAPCCNEVFGCRHCHNDATALRDKHTINRQEVESVICLVCDTEQPVAQECSNCGVNMGEYFCGKCKFFDDDIEKEQFHCDDCGICRVGGRDKYYHCQKCGSCYDHNLRDKHKCVENSMKQNCPICFEFLFDSLNFTKVLECGHTMHVECCDEMVSHNRFQCPMCFKSFCDMTNRWAQLDEEVRLTPMPAEYQYKVWVLCNDCTELSEVKFHVLGHKCGHCGSYNTRSAARPADSEANAE